MIACKQGTGEKSEGIELWAEGLERNTRTTGISLPSANVELE